MAKKIVQLLAAAGATLLLFWALSTSLGPAPPLGPLLNPASGFWASANQPEENETITIPGEALSDSVHVYYDKHRIPHIFARNTTDLYFVQGYITARDRLWQMELQTYAAAGRLSEILGERTLAYDRYQRRIGMGYAAEQALASIMSDPQTATAVKAYAAGVNAWIDQLRSAEYPVEYKILDHAPEKWTPKKTALLLKYMTYTLAGNNGDLRMSNTRAYFGDDFIKKVLDTKTDLMEPTIPASKSWEFDPVQVEQPDSVFTPSVVEHVMPYQPDPANGSNNWAVSGSKTASGHPILANDPHLNMTLPSIWYAVQLHGPHQNVMGVTLPGAPAIIIGFNEQIAWGTTNVGADVWDWYEIQFRDSTLAEYRHDNQWKSTRKRIEEIKIKGQETFVDTVFYTHHGPVVQNFPGEPMRSGIPKYHAMRWIAYEKSNEMKYFLGINRAKNYSDYRQALQHYKNPAQNWVFADSSNIAITVAGKYPAKWNEQGRFIGDGSDPKYDWQNWIPFDQIPFIKNPGRGFVSSANQNPTDDTYPYYLDDEFAPFERGRRINDRLAAMQNITPKDMQQLQLDTYSYHAKTILPTLLNYLQADTLSETGQNAYRELTEWNLKNEGNQIAPSLFAAWWDAFYSALWGDEYGTTDLPLEWPKRDETTQLIKNDSTLQWIDDVNTPQRETLKELVNRSFHGALQNLSEEYGPYGDSWKWGYVNDTDINHVGQIPGLGRSNLFTDGAGESVNAIRGSHGPSWRMVVELGPEIKAWGIYPGGQSGNPGSEYYDNMIDDWAKGELYPLWFMKNQPAKNDSVAYSIILK
ncbi:MAG: penicillin acylase family protein [Balneolaceae bacterium]|nr:penicillin acylase family protein [Balneolaceae bacterium]